MSFLKHFRRLFRTRDPQPRRPALRLEFETLETRLVPASYPVISVGHVEVSEPDSGSTPAIISVTLSKPGTERIPVYYASSNGTAKADSDYTAVRGRIDFQPGETFKNVSVDVLGDRVPEGDESFTVTFSTTGKATIPNRYANVTIHDNDVAGGARRVFAQNFDDPANDWRSGPNGFIPDTRPAGERTLQKVVPLAAGNQVLRMNLGRDVYDQVIKDWTPDSNYARYARVGIDTHALGVQNEITLKYNLWFDPGVEIEPGVSMKFNWFNGVRTSANDQFNYFTRFTPDGTFAFINNHPPGVSVGEDWSGDAALRQKGQIGRFSDRPGAAALLGGKDFWDWWRGRWHTVEVYMKVNDPGLSNGVYRLTIDGVRVLDFANGRFRNRGNDTFGEVNAVGMYGGASAPQKSFGIQLDSVEVWDGLRS